ncbi:flagellar hook-basal body complex protein FliE [Agromyces sp. NPDC060279]|uniref:flagellar hook-basal body complex protein FliE n=1 Tax=Agromyces sp. NPDC060279 TaxID=3347092 RepID=UPI003648912B
MPIPGVNGVQAGVQAVAQSGYLEPDASRTGGVAGTGGAAFAGVLGAVDGAQALQAESKTLALKAVTGDLTDIHQATLASSRAAVTLELVAAVRNKGVEAFNEIMRMQA